MRRGVCLRLNAVCHKEGDPTTNYRVAACASGEAKRVAGCASGEARCVDGEHFVLLVRCLNLA